MNETVPFCPNCSIVLDFHQMANRKCNNCLHEFDIWHVTPNNDVEQHRESYSCSCVPRIEIESGNMIIIHNSFDGREGIELANEILNK